jgi:ribonucleoside-triphosphate reductase
MKNIHGETLTNKCNCCGSHDVDHVTRVTGYFSKDSMWNKGKIAELRDREKNKNRFCLAK